ncbi:MAG: glycosyltransferase family 2 protein [Candidatus Dependentiae bacterium]|nr:glycosyltransferase family 2 protein [Candidatus Dependentiae bacterium]
MMNTIKKVTMLSIGLLSFINHTSQLPFIVIIPSYNNEQWCQINLKSALEQKYDNYRVMYIDDCSTDRTGELITEIADNHPSRDKLTIQTNATRRGALANLYDAIHSCPDKAIIVTLDGDDWFANDRVLERLNQAYADSDVWMTYGSYISWPQNSRDPWIHPLPASVIVANSYRSYQWVTTHLRTFYARLFKMVKKEDLLHNGEFFQMTWDMAFMFPMLEMAKGHAHYIDDILYIYNRSNPIGDRNSNRMLQESLERLIRAKSSYDPIKDLFEVQ